MARAAKPSERASRYFTWRELLWLPKWNRLANESDGLSLSVRTNLEELASALDRLRDHFGAPLIIHCAYRPPEYNMLVGGAPRSQHLLGRAADFHVDGLTCEEARQDILQEDLLTTLALRMEDNGADASWLHIDLKPVPPGGKRFFKP